MYRANSQCIGDTRDLIQVGFLRISITACLPSSVSTLIRTGISVWLCLFAFAVLSAGQWRTGYFMQREAAGQTAATIPWSKYTHVIHSALRPTYSNGTCGLDSTEGLLSAANIKDFVNHARAAGVKPIIGIRQDDPPMAIAACTAPENIAEFVERIRSFVTNSGYDGVDLAWETNPISLQYQDLIKRLRTALPMATLSVMVGVDERFMTAAVQQDLDQINIRAYDLDSRDLAGNAVTYTWYHSATLQGANTKDQAMDVLSSYYVSAGNVSNKLGLIVPFFGRVAKGCLNDTGTNGVSDPNQAWVGCGDAGFISYRDLVSSPFWSLGTRVWDDARRSQYIQYRGGSCPSDAFVSYAGPEQLSEVGAIIKADKLGGIAAYGLPYEFIPTLGGDARYPLSSAVYRAMVDADAAPQSSNEPTTPRAPRRATGADPKKRAVSSSDRSSAQIAPKPVDSGQTFTYYVDSAAGSDTNPGTIAKPWKTVAKVNATTLNPGQSVGFKRGGIWREMLAPKQSGTAGSPITFGAYGSAAQPIISGASMVTGWTQVKGSNVWFSPLGSIAPISAFSDGAFLIRKTTQASMIAGSWYYDGSANLYVWESDSSSPRGHTIEAAQLSTPVWLGGKSYITLNNLRIEKSNSSFGGGVQIDGQSTASNGIQVLNCTVDYTVGGIYVFSAGSVVISGNTVYGNQTLSGAGISVNQGRGTGSSNLSILNNTIYNVQIGINTPTGVTSNIAAGLISGNTIYNLTNNGINLNNSTGITIANNIVYGGGTATPDTTGIHFTNAPNTTVYGNTVYNWSDPSFIGGNGIQADTNSDNALIYHNIVYGNSGAGISVIDSAGAGIYENTAYGNSQGTMAGEIYIASPTLGRSSATIKNNIGFVTGGAYGIYIDAKSAANLPANAITNNIWWKASGNWYYNGAAGGSEATWNGLSYVGTDLQSNPLLTNPPSTMTLQPGSPAIGGGIYIPGVSAANPPDIGAK